MVGGITIMDYIELAKKLKDKLNNEGKLEVLDLINLITLERIIKNSSELI